MNEDFWERKRKREVIIIEEKRRRRRKRRRRVTGWAGWWKNWLWIMTGNRMKVSCGGGGWWPFLSLSFSLLSFMFFCVKVERWREKKERKRKGPKKKDQSIKYKLLHAYNSILLYIITIYFVFLFTFYFWFVFFLQMFQNMTMDLAESSMPTLWYENIWRLLNTSVLPDPWLQTGGWNYNRSQITRWWICRITVGHRQVSEITIGRWLHDDAWVELQSATDDTTPQ